MDEHASSSVTNKNAGDRLGDMAFIFGSQGDPTPRGVVDYYQDGVIVVNHLSVSSWGDYLECNHPKGSTSYTCKCHKHGGCDMERAGKEQTSHTDNHIWYSFPKAGEGKYWDYEHHEHCDTIEVRASCVIDALAKKAGCPGTCNAQKKNAGDCVHCVNKLSDKEKEHVWDNQIWDGGCPDSRRRRSTSTGNRSAVMASMEVMV